MKRIFYIYKIKSQNVQKSSKISKNSLIDQEYPFLTYESKLKENFNDRDINFNYFDLNLKELRKQFNDNLEDFELDKLNSYLKNTFKLFDLENKNEIHVDDIKNCIYNLNLCPCEDQLNEILKEMNVKLDRKVKRNIRFNPNQTKNDNKISFEIFSSVLNPILAYGKCLPKTENLLRKAFETFGKEAKLSKCVDWKEFEDAIYNIGFKFKDDEFELMKEHLSPYILKGKLYFEKYLQDLSPQIDYELFLKNSKYFNQNFILKRNGFEL